MDVSIKLDHQVTTYTNGDMICGSVVLYCPSTITVSKITASLTGESVLNLTESNNYLGYWKQEEKHRFLHESQVIAPHHSVDGQKKGASRLEFGYHSFCFSLKIPNSPDCCSCPPNSPVFLSGIEKQGSRSGDFPPSITDRVKGVDVSYRIDVSVITMRSLFKTTTTKSLPITVWPIDPQLPCASFPTNAFSCTNSITAKILGPAARLPSNSHTQSAKDPYLISTTHETANLKIRAHFLPDYTLTHNRTIAMRLDIEQLNSTSHDLCLQSFQMLVFGYTTIKVGAATNTEMTCSTVVSRSNLDMKVCAANSDIGMYYEIDPSLWEGKQLSDDVVPSFDSCGLARRYEVEVLMGFQCRGVKDGRVLFVQLRTPVRISSGIYPDRPFTTADGVGMRDVLSDACRGDHLSAYNTVANGFKYESPSASPEYDELEMPPMPPTYDEAVKLGMNKGLEKEIGFTTERW